MVALGEGVEGRLGARVGVGWLASACGACKFCRRGEENLCPEARFTGYHRDGGYAEYTLARAAFTYPLPEGTPCASPLGCVPGLSASGATASCGTGTP